MQGDFETFLKASDFNITINLVLCKVEKLTSSFLVCSIESYDNFDLNVDYKVLVSELQMIVNEYS